MKYFLISIILVGFVSCSSSQIYSTKFQLAQPAIIYDNIYYSGSQEISMFLDLEGTSIYYTLDGTEPTVKSIQYKSPIEISESLVVKAMATHPDCLTSDIASTEFVKMVEFPALVSAFSTKDPSPKYPGEGPLGLVDRKKGSINFQDGRWMGLEGDDYEVDIEFNRSIMVNKIIISSLSSPGSWIFPPAEAEISISFDGKKYDLFSTVKYKSEISSGENKFVFLKTEGPKRKIKNLKIHIKNTGTLPDWHPGAGGRAWLFLDEIFFE